MPTAQGCSQLGLVAPTPGDGGDQQLNWVLLLLEDDGQGSRALGERHDQSPMGRR
jgi:hypothetical protein